MLDFSLIHQTTPTSTTKVKSIPSITYYSISFSNLHDLKCITNIPSSKSWGGWTQKETTSLTLSIWRVLCFKVKVAATLTPFQHYISSTHFTAWKKKTKKLKNEALAHQSAFISQAASPAFLSA